MEMCPRLEFTPDLDKRMAAQRRISESRKLKLALRTDATEMWVQPWPLRGWLALRRQGGPS